jgi:hypothetical protein
MVEEAISGRMVSPRNLTTFEVIGPMMIRTKSSLGVNRKDFNINLGLVEGLKLIAGVNDDIIPESINTVKTHSDISNRLGFQMEGIIQLLRDDKWTRRGIGYFNSPINYANDAFYATSVHWMIRNDTLETVVNVRSWDLAEIAPLDFIRFGILSQAVARCLNVQVGEQYFSASSAHVYPETQGLAHAESDIEFNLGPAWCVPGDYWKNYQRRAEEALKEYDVYGIVSPGVLRWEKVH